MAALTDIHLLSLENIARGKVRDLYTLPDPETLLFIASDRVSAFDVVLKNGIPDKGAILNLLSAHWFQVLSDLLPHLKTHFLSLNVPIGVPPEEALVIKNRSMTVRKLEVVKIEAIVRGYLTGSAWKEYQTKGTVHGIEMPEGLKLCEKLPEPLYTPSTKAPAGEHDENIHPDEAWKEIGDKDTAERVKELSLQIYKAASTYAEERGIIIADTKFEFAKDAEGVLFLADEVLTPDSSRFWPKQSYEVGKEQESFDKQFIRDWLNRQGLKGKEGVEIPGDIAKATSQKYDEAFYLLTGKRFEETIERREAESTTGESLT